MLLRVPGNSGVPDTLDIVLCGDPSVSLRLHALSLVFRARMYSLMFSNLFCWGGLLYTLIYEVWFDCRRL